MPGKGTSKAEVQDITRHGIWLLVQGREFMLPFEKFPWFKNASIAAVYNLELTHKDHLHWPDLDVDLHVESLDHPERYPLLAKSSEELLQEDSTRAPRHSVVRERPTRRRK